MTGGAYPSTTMSTNQPLNAGGGHIAWVDFLRILACFLVVLAHCCDPFVGSFDLATKDPTTIYLSHPHGCVD